MSHYLVIVLALGCGDATDPGIEKPAALFEVEIVEPGSGARSGFVIEPDGIFSYSLGVAPEPGFDTLLAVAAVHARHSSGRARFGGVPAGTFEQRAAILSTISGTTFEHVEGCPTHATVWYAGYVVNGAEYRRVLLRSAGKVRNEPLAGTSAAALANWLASFDLYELPTTCNV